MFLFDIALYPETIEPLHIIQQLADVAERSGAGRKLRHPYNSLKNYFKYSSFILDDYFGLAPCGRSEAKRSRSQGASPYD